MLLFIMAFTLSFAAHNMPVAVVVHGLNNKPSSMKPFAQTLKDAGIKPYIVTLTGHSDMTNQEKKKMIYVKAQNWLDDVSKVYNQAKSENPDSPIYLLAHSIGGLIGTVLQNESKVAFEKMILVAPALKLKWGSRFLLSIPLDPLNYIPSFTPDDYAANSSLVVGVYNQLSILLKRFNHNIQTQNLHVPTLVLIDKKDELVSGPGLKKLIEDEGLETWKYIEITKSKDAAIQYRHLVHDEKAMGKKGWKSIQKKVKAFLTTVE
ncbi:MAG: alpha/beta hydrolase [Bacteriovoracaceae bacterium]|nr:alpha/beta hydrolase [Bacteriovoracaceae bacterium]